MAKFSLQFTPYSRRDPVTGERGNYIRNAHSIQSSKRLKAFQSCVADAMRGKTFKGGSPAENARAIRNAFSSAAKSCAA